MVKELAASFLVAWIDIEYVAPGSRPPTVFSSDVVVPSMVLVEPVFWTLYL